jgi:hypothetical protein
MYQEWFDTQDNSPLVQQVRQDLANGRYDEEAGDLEDLSAVQWQGPSDLGGETAMDEIEKFNAAMAANSHLVVTDDGGEWI